MYVLHGLGVVANGQGVEVKNRGLRVNETVEVLCGIVMALFGDSARIDVSKECIVKRACVIIIRD